MPRFHQNLNARKTLWQLDLRDPDDLARLHDAVIAADVLITSARPRALDALGVTPARIFKDNPTLIWIAVTGYGFTGEAGTRVAFGDDASAAGGLVRWDKYGRPNFIGDALADPVTGLSAAAQALRLLQSGGAVMVDAAMARCSAEAAVACGYASAA